MTQISRYLEAERIDPSLPRDAFVPPDYDNLDDADEGGLYDDLGIVVEGDNDE